jgi:hypothetical protein
VGRDEDFLSLLAEPLRPPSERPILRQNAIGKYFSMQKTGGT